MQHTQIIERTNSQELIWVSSI